MKSHSSPQKAPRSGNESGTAKTAREFLSRLAWLRRICYCNWSTTLGVLAWIRFFNDPSHRFFQRDQQQLHLPTAGKCILIIRESPAYPSLSTESKILRMLSDVGLLPPTAAVFPYERTFPQRSSGKYHAVRRTIVRPMRLDGFVSLVSASWDVMPHGLSFASIR